METPSESRRDRVHPVLVALAALAIGGTVVVAARVPLWKKEIFVGRTSLLLAARNHHRAGTLDMESEKGVILSTPTLRDSPPPERPLGNRLSILAFSLAYRLLGDSMASAHLFGSVVLALAIAVFFVLFYLRLGFRIAVLAGLAWATFPTFVAYLAPGHSEISLLFLAIACLAALGPARPTAWHWLLAGAAAGIAVAGKLSFAFYVPVLGIWCLVARGGVKGLVAFALPLPLAAVLYLGPDRLLSSDWAEDYTIVVGGFEQEKHPAFRMYGAVYPDPWTFRHDREAFDAAHVRPDNKYYGFTTVELPRADRMKIHLQTLVHYAKCMAEVRVFGGPLVGFAMLLGVLHLWTRDRRLLAFALLALAVTIAGNVLSLDARGEHHILQILFVFALLAGAGLAACLGALAVRVPGRLRAALLGALFVGAFLAHQGAAARVAFERIYSGAGQTDRLIELVADTREAGVRPGQVVAMGGETPVVFQLALYADVDVVAFKETTVRKLLDEGRLDEAFAEYEVEWILGYSPETTRRIVEATGARVVGDAR